jgi:hypothetical protein
MGASGYSPIWRRFLQKAAPFLFSVCPAGNYHWRWQNVCWCVSGCNGALLALRTTFWCSKNGTEWRTAYGQGLEWREGNN